MRILLMQIKQEITGLEDQQLIMQFQQRSKGHGINTLLAVTRSHVVARSSLSFDTKQRSFPVQTRMSGRDVHSIESSSARALSASRS
jgi:hypothetical protein